MLVQNAALDAKLLMVSLQDQPKPPNEQSFLCPWSSNTRHLFFPRANSSQPEKKQKNRSVYCREPLISRQTSNLLKSKPTQSAFIKKKQEKSISVLSRYKIQQFIMPQHPHPCKIPRRQPTRSRLAFHRKPQIVKLVSGIVGSRNENLLVRESQKQRYMRQVGSVPLKVRSLQDRDFLSMQLVNRIGLKFLSGVVRLKNNANCSTFCIDKQVFTLHHDKSLLDFPLQFYSVKGQSIHKHSYPLFLDNCFHVQKNHSKFLVVPENWLVHYSHPYLSQNYSERSANQAVSDMRQLLSESRARSKQQLRVEKLKALQKMSENWMKQRNTLEEGLKHLQQRIQIYDKAIRDYKQKNQRKKTFVLKLLFAAFGFQTTAIHYCIYSALSWDVMEPIACLLGLLDVNIAIWFAILFNKDYSHKGILETRLEKLPKQLREQRQVVQEYRAMHKQLKTRWHWLSADPMDLIRAIQQ